MDGLGGVIDVDRHACAAEFPKLEMIMMIILHKG